MAGLLRRARASHKLFVLQDLRPGRGAEREAVGPPRGNDPGTPGGRWAVNPHEPASLKQRKRAAMTDHFAVSAKDSRRADRGPTSASEKKIEFDSFTRAAPKLQTSDLWLKDGSGHAAPEAESDLHTLQKKGVRGRTGSM